MFYKIDQIKKVLQIELPIIDCFYLEKTLYLYLC